MACNRLQRRSMGGVWFTNHSLRATGATALFDTGVSEAVIQKPGAYLSCFLVAWKPPWLQKGEWQGGHASKSRRAHPAIYTCGSVNGARFPSLCQTHLSTLWPLQARACFPTYINCCGLFAPFQLPAVNVNVALAFFVAYLRSSMGQERLSGLALMHVHYGMELDLEEIIINIFARKHPRRMVLSDILRE